MRAFISDAEYKNENKDRLYELSVVSERQDMDADFNWRIFFSGGKYGKIKSHVSAYTISF